MEQNKEPRNGPPQISSIHVFIKVQKQFSGARLLIRWYWSNGIVHYIVENKCPKPYISTKVNSKWIINVKI